MGRAVVRVLRPRRRANVVRAAGGVLIRPSQPGRVEVALIHRPDRDDWSLPKGKVDPGETYEECALREVLEETGYQCRLGDFVGFTEYEDRRGRRKVVGYWVMEVEEGEFAVSREVDEMRWVDLELAIRTATYQRDGDLLASLDSLPLAGWG